MRPETFTLSQKELQRVSVISTCIKGDLACAAPRRPWLAPSTPASTTTISAKNSVKSKASPWLVRLCAACCAKKALARPANAALPLIASAVCAPLAKANSCNSMAALTTGSKVTARASPLWACRTMLPEKFSRPSSSPQKPPQAISACCSGIFVRSDPHWSLEEELAGQRQPTQFGRALAQLGITFIFAQSPQAKGRVERLWAVL